MSQAVPLPLQTTYAELVEQCHLARMETDFPATGTFILKRAGDRAYWYFRAGTEAGRRLERYVGPSTPELDARVAAQRQAKSDGRARRAMVVALQRAGLAAPTAQVGRILEELAAAGVFRLRGVLVGTVAYQTYSALLGRRLGVQNLQTADLDLAQFPSVSVAVGDDVGASLLDILRRADPTFRAVPGLSRDERPTQFRAAGFRVDVLAPNRGPDTSDPLALPALKVHGTPLRFLDFLIYREVQAAVLWGTGIAVNVPAPERYALHKLLVSRARLQTPESQVKASKDLRQAAELIPVLAETRPYELREAWEELLARGPKWRQFAEQAVTLLGGTARSSAAREALSSITISAPAL